ncbi:MAG TPA: hypothetical protein VNL70_11330 [Tepidisphaeraceae bacterium]|nr:hypothetical protein [Tepidisphaeraceae bacterium]
MAHRRTSGGRYRARGTAMAWSAAAAAAGAAMVLSATMGRAQTVLFSDDFDAGTSASRYDVYSVDNQTSPPTFGLGTAAGDVAHDFAFNYGAYTYRYTDAFGSAVTATIPSAPRSTAGSTIGLRLDVNNFSGGTAIINLYPKLAQYAGGLLPSGDQKLTFDLWMNYNGGYEGGGGSTEWFVAGINQEGGGIGGPVVGPGPFPTRRGYAMAVNGERGNGADYRVYRNNTRYSGTLPPLTIDEAGYVAQVDGTFGRDNGRNAYYQSLFPFNDGAGWETPGSIGKHWVTVEISYVDGIVYYRINGALIAARSDKTVSSGHILLGYDDFNNTTAALDDITGVDANFGVFDNVVLEQVTQVRPRWNLSGSGNWAAAEPGNWTVGVPDGIEATADFGASITAPSTINVEAGGKTVRSMVFDSTHRYTLSGGTITFNSLTSGIHGSAVVRSGSHTISAPIVLSRPFTADIMQTSSALTLGAELRTNNFPIFKEGAGVLEVTNVRTTASLTINGGSVRVANNGGNAGVSDVGTLTLAGATAAWTARLDLNNNDLIVRTGSLATITNQLKSALENGGNFDWLGPGIGSTQANVQNTTAGSFLYGLGVILNDLSQVGGSGPIYTDFAGISGLVGNEVLVKFTYFGDADLSGSIDATDYSLIDNGYVNSLSGWLNGDFDYSGSIDATDYALIDNAYVNQAGPLAEALIAEHARMFGGEYLAALRAIQSGVIPEPVSAGLVLGVALGLTRQCRRPVCPQGT